MTQLYNLNIMLEMENINYILCKCVCMCVCLCEKTDRRRGERGKRESCTSFQQLQILRQIINFVILIADSLLICS